ncbi:MAG: PAS domain S-box protein [Desulforhopalus sp.]|nr:PAS domain S-box protein [Desulforhopalus sp.]
MTLIILCLSVLIFSGDALAERNQPNILVLNSYHQGENWTDNEIAGIFSELLTQYPTLVPLVETLDTKRYPSPAHLDFLKDYLLRKYQDRRIDLIIALDNPALNLIIQNPNELFPDVPVVFAGINGFHPQMLVGRKKITGVVERQDVAGTVKMALAMHPEVSRVLAIHDYTASGLAVRQETETALAQFAGKLQISYSADLPFDALREELQEMPDNGLVLILSYVTDKAGRIFTREESTRLITSLSSAPVYAMHETRLGFGILGGLLLEGKEHGRQAARLAFRVLQGEDPDTIAVEESLSRSILDYDGLRRFQVPEDLWPHDAVVINRPVSLWSRHRNVLIPTIAAIIILLGLSSMLLGTVIRLRRAKKTIRKSEEKYRVLFNSFPLGITVSDQDGKIVETNAMATTLLGVPKEEHEKRQIDGAEWRIIRPDGSPMPVAEYASTRALQEKRLVENVEMGIVKPGAEITWINVTATPLNLEKYGVVVTYVDVTARRSMEAENRRFKTISDNSVYGKAIADLEGQVLYVNRIFANIHGYEPEQLLGKHLSVFHSREQMAAVDRLNAAMIREGYFPTTTVWHRHLDGREFPMLMSGVLIKDDYGNPQCIAASAIDISAQHQAEQAVIQSNKLLQTIINTAPMRIFYKDRELRYIGCNDAFARDAGVRSPEDLVGKDDYQLAWKEQAELYRADDLHVLESGMPKLFYDEPQTTPEGKQIWLRTSKVPLLGDANEIIGVLGMYEDISDWKKAEIDNSRLLLRQRAILDNLPMMAWLKDTESRLEMINEPYALTCGHTIDECIGKTDLDLFPEEMAKGFMADDLEVCRSGRKKQTEEKIFSPEGIKWHLTYKTPIYDEHGLVIGTTGIAQDITERKQAEAEREKLQAQLQQAQKMEAIGTLAGGIAHDFNNILGAILGYAEMAQEDSPAGSILRNDIDQIVTASHRAKELVKQILAFSRQAQIERIPLQPALIIKETLKMLRSSLPSTVTIQQDIDQEAGPLLADPTQIHQVMLNLCTNAFHAMEEGGGILSISLKNRELTREDLASEPHVHPGRFVQLSIGDTGPGIAPEIMEKIFDPYFTTKEVGKGTGMGLAIIHGITKSYKGFVSCHSTLGEGTIFHVFLPVVADPALLESESASLDLTQLGNERILFVDDDEILAEMGKGMLERLGYRVTVRRNSLEALNTFHNQPDQFDLVITDQTMPGMTGSDLARRMLQIRPGMPIILCTGYSTLLSEDKVKSLGIKGFAMKPLARKDIAMLIREVLAGSV